MKIAVIYGSNRREREGIKAARYVVNKLRERGHETTLIDSKVYDLPLLDLMYKEYRPEEVPSGMEEIHRILAAAEGFVIVAGEYNHSIPAPLKNLLDHFREEYYFKPSAIVSCSSGPFGGVRVADHLRIVLAQLGMTSIPSTFPVSAVQEAFDDEGRAMAKEYDKRIVRFLDEFEWYLSAYKAQREKGVPY